MDELYPNFKSILQSTKESTPETLFKLLLDRLAGCNDEESSFSL